MEAEFLLNFRLDPSDVQSFNSSCQNLEDKSTEITTIHPTPSVMYYIVYPNKSRVLFTSDLIYLSLWKAASQLNMTSIEVC